MKKFIFLINYMFANLLYADEYDFDSMFSADTLQNTSTNTINVNGFLKQAKTEQDKITQEEQERERIADASRDPLADKCAILIDDFVAYSACMKNENAVFGNNLNAYYAMRKECGNLAGNDDTGLSYLCSHPNKNGCIGLKASQSTINACYNCEGSNLWLRVYATGTVLKCY